ncbi:hypothetical protein BJV77DRAFT_1029246 [Russula vinacea]|nr:hypothetical protein BJV77DRAFT_1029246 [Russula vinacea]
MQRCSHRRVVDSTVMETEFSVVLRHVHHTVNGIYIWEYFTTLDYELDVIRGRCPHQWTIWIYSLMRAATLLAIIPDFVNLNVVTPINCQAWMTFELIFSYLVLFAASILICVRMYASFHSSSLPNHAIFPNEVLIKTFSVAIWKQNKHILAIAIIIWVTNASTIVRGIMRLSTAWDPTSQGCVVFNSEDKFSITVSLMTDIVLFVVILVGLRRLRGESGGSFDPGSLPWKQGIVWLIIAAAAEVPPTVFINLNLNASFNIIMFQLPALIIVSIAATRMYRSPSEAVLGSTETSFLDMGSRRKRTKRASKTNWSHSAPTEMPEVDVDTVYERSPPSQTIICIDRQPEGSSLTMENRI